MFRLLAVMTALVVLPLLAACYDSEEDDDGMGTRPAAAAVVLVA